MKLRNENGDIVIPATANELIDALDAEYPPPSMGEDAAASLSDEFFRMKFAFESGRRHIIDQLLEARK